MPRKTSSPQRLRPGASHGVHRAAQQFPSQLHLATEQLPGEGKELGGDGLAAGGPTGGWRKSSVFPWKMVGVHRNSEFYWQKWWFIVDFPLNMVSESELSNGKMWLSSDIVSFPMTNCGSMRVRNCYHLGEHYISPSLCLFSYLSIYLSIHPSIHPSIYPSIYPSLSILPTNRRGAH